MDPAETEPQDVETFDESALLEAAVSAVEGDEPPESDHTATGADDAQPDTAAVVSGDKVDLSSLRAIAAERAKSQQGQQKPAEPEQKAATDFSQLADQLTGAEAYKKAAAKMGEGDASELAKLLNVDEATLYERWTDRALRGDASVMEGKVKALEAELAELRGKKLPDNVVTTESLKEREQQAAYEANRNRFSEAASDAERHPVLSKIDAGLALQYGEQADRYLRDSGKPLSIENILSIAEELASEQLNGLLEAQQSPGRAQQSPGVKPAASASTEPSGSTRAGVTIDNRTTAESASPLPDYEDESAYVARARLVAESM